MSLRERQKQRRNEAVIHSAQQLFQQYGYGKTTVEQIADQAEVGVATVYKYFGGKAGIIAALGRQNLAQVFAHADALVARPMADPAAGLVRLFAIYELNRSNQEFAATSCLLDSLQHEPAVKALEQWAGAQYRQRIANLLMHYQASGRLAPDLRLIDAVEILFALFCQHVDFSSHWRPTGASPDFADLQRRIELLAATWASSVAA